MSCKTRHYVEFWCLDLIGWGIGRKGKREGEAERGFLRDSLFPFALLSPPPPPLLFAPATQAKTVENQNGKVINFHFLNWDAVPSLQFPPNFLTSYRRHTLSKRPPVQKDTLFKTLNGEIVYSEDSRPWKPYPVQRHIAHTLIGLIRKSPAPPLSRAYFE